MRQRERPAVDLGTRLDGHVFRNVHLVEARIQHEEAVGVPERVDERTRHVGDDLDGDALRHVGRQPREEIPAQRIGADGVEHVVGIDDVAERLRHLLAVFVDDEVQADAVPVGHAVRNERRDRVQRIEPAARLVDRLADEIGREMLLEHVLVFERVMPLRVRHGTRIEPAVDHLGHSPPGLAVFLVSDVVHRGPVKIELLQRLPGQLLELLY